MPLLEQLAAGDPEIWNDAFRCLYPVAFEAARTRLGENFNGDCEDVAMETLSEILEKGAQVNSEQELKPLTAAIARNKATDRLRRHLAEKRGGNKVQSLDAMIEENAGELSSLPQDEFVDRLAVQELRELLTDLSAEVKKEYRIVLRDHFFDQLSYNEIAEKRKISVGSVGVYLQRGLGSLRSVIARKPKLQGEFLAMLSDASVVRIFLPLISAIQVGGWIVSHAVPTGMASVAKNTNDNLSDEDRLQMISERLPHVQSLGESQQAVLREKLKLKHPAQFHCWQQAQEGRVHREEPSNRGCSRLNLRNQIIALLVLLLVLYGIIRLIRWLLA